MPCRSWPERTGNLAVTPNTTRSPEGLQMGFAVERFDHIVLNCNDVEATASWYERVLGAMTSHYCRDIDGNLIEIAVY